MIRTLTTTVDILRVQGVRDLLLLLETDTEIILTEANKPIVKLAVTHFPNIPENGRVPDMHPKIWIGDDFDEQLPEKYWVNRKL